MPSRQAVIGFDGTTASERPVRAAGELLAPRPVLVMVAVEEGEAFASLIAPLGAAGLPGPSSRSATPSGPRRRSSSRRCAPRRRASPSPRRWVSRRRGSRFADDVPVAETLLRVAEVRHAPVIVAGAHRRGVLSELLVGSTAPDLLKRSPRPVLVVREQPPEGSEGDRPNE
jgi:nucleotide-binding universal stress UspA family protein